MDIIIDVHNIESAIPSADDFAKGLVNGNPAEEEILNRGGDPEQVRFALAEEIRSQLGDNMPLNALFVQARC